MDRVRRRFEALMARWNGSLPGRFVLFWGEKRGSELAIVLAYGLLFAIFPLALSVVTVAGVFLGDSAVRSQIATALVNILPLEVAGEVLRTIDGINSNARSLGLLGVIGLIWSSSSIFTALETTSNRLWDLSPRSIVQQRLIGLLTLPIIGLGVLASMAVGSVSTVVTTMSDALLPEWLANQDMVVTLVGVVTTFVILTITMLVIYTVTPNKRIGVRKSLGGAILAAGLLTLLTLIFPIYLGVAGGFGQFGAAFGFTFLIVTYLNLISQIVVIGAAWNAFRSRCGTSAPSSVPETAP